MTYVTTDFVAPYGSNFKLAAVIITANDATGYSNNAPTQGLNSVIGVSAGDQNNFGGRFGWVSFGVKINSLYYFYEKQALNYYNQIFLPQNNSCNVVRIWLAKGVIITPILQVGPNAVLEYIISIEQQLEAYLINNLVQAAKTKALTGSLPTPLPTGIPQTGP